MPRIIDGEGRVFGRFNLVDAVILAFVLLLIPVAYATYLLFRPAQPRITSVESAQLTYIEERAAQGTRLAGKLKVHGTGLRPVLRAKIGSTDAVAFIFENPTSADVLFGDVPAGTHDLVLYDAVQEVARAAGAVTIPEKSASGRTSVAIVGTLIDLDATTAANLKTGATFPQGERQAEILALGPVENARLPINGRIDAAIDGKQQRAAMIATRCDIDVTQPRECKAGGGVLGAGVTFLMPGTSGGLRLLVEEIVPASAPTPARVRVRLFGLLDALSLIRVDDADQPHLAIDRRGAVIRSLGARREGTGELTVLLSQDPGSVLASAARQEQIGSVDVMLTAGLDQSRTGWRYRGDTLRVGGPMTFTTATYTLRGIVLGLDVGEKNATSDSQP